MTARAIATVVVLVSVTLTACAGVDGSERGAIRENVVEPGITAITEDAPALTAKVVKLDRNAHKYYYLWLDNGHVWREKDRSRFRYKVGDSITISKGAFGANQLKLEGKTGMVLVERVK